MSPAVTSVDHFPPGVEIAQVMVTISLENRVMPPPRSGVSRRRHPRIEIDGGFRALDITTGIWVDLRNIGLGGFQAVSSRVIAVGETHDFSAFVMDDAYEISATAVHCQPTVGGSAWVVGWKACDDARTRKGIAGLIARLTSADWHTVLVADAAEDTEKVFPP